MQIKWEMENCSTAATFPVGGFIQNKDGPKLMYSTRICDLQKVKTECSVTPVGGTQINSGWPVRDMCPQVSPKTSYQPTIFHVVLMLSIKMYQVAQLSHSTRCLCKLVFILCNNLDFEPHILQLDHI